MSVARELWKRIESIHAVTYFAPESAAAAKEAGLKGFWMGYFGFRAAPLGAASPGLVHATFANFARPMVERSLPDAWALAWPHELVEVRAVAAAAALRRVVPDIDGAISDTTPDLPEALDSIVDVADGLGRPLFAANAALERRNDPVERLWQACTSLREHRGDGHVVALASLHVDGCEAHRLHAATHGTPHEILRDNRGFDDDEWAAAGRRLEVRQLIDGHSLTAAGQELVARVEALTDELAEMPLRSSGIDLDNLIDALTPIALEITESGILPFPNPMGLPRW